MTKQDQYVIMMAAIKASLSGALTEHESCDVAKTMTNLALDIFDAEELTDLHEAIMATVAKHRPVLAASQRFAWQKVADKFAYIVEKLNEPKGSPCRNIVLKPTRKRY